MIRSLRRLLRPEALVRREALGTEGGGRVPDLLQIISEGRDLVLFGVGERGRPGGLVAGELGFGAGQFREGGVPLGSMLRAASRFCGSAAR